MTMRCSLAFVFSTLSRRGLQTVLGLTLAGLTATALAQADAPVAARKPHDVTVHGDKRIDDYFWLRERKNPAVLAHLKAEAAYTESWFKPLQPLQAALFKEMVGRIQQADESVPSREGAYWYFTRFKEGQQYPIYLRRKGADQGVTYDPSAPEEVLVDMNRLAKGRKHLDLGEISVSSDGRLLAYTLDFNGGREFKLVLKDLQTGRLLPAGQTKVMSMAWAEDGRSLFYVTGDASLRQSRLWRHEVGAKRRDTLVWEEKDPLFNIQLIKSADRRQLYLSSVSKNTTEWRVLPADQPKADWRVVLPRRDGVEYSLEHHGKQLYVVINDRGPNYRLLRLADERLPLDAAALGSGEELIAHRDDAMIEGLAMFRQHLAVQVREAGSLKVQVLELNTLARRNVPLPEAGMSTLAGRYGPLNHEFDTDVLRLQYQSLTTPVSTYDFNISNAALQLRKTQVVLGGFDAERYESKRLWATARDGVKVPITVVYAKALRKAGPQPLLLEGYGSYGLASDPMFSSSLLSLLDRGVVVAIGHVRGGGDMGRAWYLDGKLSKKMNTFTDFVAVSEALIAQGYTRPDQLIITGGSAGGLLMGATVNLRPDLFKAVVAEVPFVDVINTMLDASLPLTTEEYIEWGNPNIAAEYAWMRAYSPYDNLKPGAYPAMLLRTGLYDSQVPYWEPAKYVAKLRTLKTDANPLLFDINMAAGHGGASGRFDALQERAKSFSFMLQQWGLAERLQP